jgi:hypothetical protein
MHGSGDRINAIVRAMGARNVHGFGLSADCTWPPHGSEVERLLQLTDQLGLPRRGFVRAVARPRLRARACRLAVTVAALAGRVLRCSGRRAGRRRPGDRVLTDTAGERVLGRAVAAQMHAPVLDLVGRTTLWELGALVEWSRYVVCNGTGISHIAAVACGVDARELSGLPCRVRVTGTAERTGTLDEPASLHGLGVARSANSAAREALLPPTLARARRGFLDDRS